MTRSHNLAIRVLASGSSGNCILVRSPRANLLVDAGLSGRELVRRLHSAGLAPSDISGVVVTHEHHDHVRGISVLSRRHRIPVYLNASTMESAGLVGLPTAHVFETGQVLELGDLNVQTFPVTHDAVDPIGLSIRNSTCRIGVALDMGYPTRLVKQRLHKSDALVLEFNHDPEMLRLCNRPWELKQRILSKRGHMSNQAALELLCELMHERLQAVVLAHMSREANNARLALSLVSGRLAELGRRDIRVYAGEQDQIGAHIGLE